MIAYQDKFANALFSVFSFGTKYAQQLRFQYLSSLIYNSHIEMLQSESSGLPEIDATVPTNIRQRLIRSQTSVRRIQVASSFSIK